MRIAVLHDWLYTWRGGEKCLEQILDIADEAVVFTLFSSNETCMKYLPDTQVVSSFASYIPFSKKIYRGLLPLYPLLAQNVEKKLHAAHAKKPFDLVVSISHCAVKNIAPPKGIPHLCYCLTPVRYIWDQYEAYFSGKWFEPFVSLVRKPLQRWDQRGSEGVTHFVGISEYVRKRIQRYYDRDADVIYPPVATHRFDSEKNEKTRNTTLSSDKVASPYLLMVNALVPYKKTSLVVEAFCDIPFCLKVVGTGPEYDTLKSRATDNVELLGHVDDETLVGLYHHCAGLVYAAEEDFGIAPVEAQAAGKPVLCFHKGGCRETIVSEGVRVTGMNFKQQNVESIHSAVQTFLAQISAGAFSEIICKENATRFSESEFQAGISNMISSMLQEAGPPDIVRPRKEVAHA